MALSFFGAKYYPPFKARKFDDGDKRSLMMERQIKVYGARKWHQGQMNGSNITRRASVGVSEILCGEIMVKYILLGYYCISKCQNGWEASIAKLEMSVVLESGIRRSVAICTDMESKFGVYKRYFFTLWFNINFILGPPTVIFLTR